MKILSAGNVSHDNPHELLVNKSLEKLEFDVISIDKKKLFPLLTGYLLTRQATIYHLHWLKPFWCSPKPIKSWFKSLRFWTDLLLIKILGLKLVWTIHNQQNHEQIQLSLERINYKVVSLLADVILVHCQTAKQLMQSQLHLDTSKVKVITHAAYIGAYDGVLSQAAARKKLILPAQARVFLFIGTLRAYKGLFELIQAFHQHVTDPAARLVIAGWIEPHRTKALLTAVKIDERIILYPQKLTDDEVYRYLTSADVVVLPYKQILNSGSLWLAYTFGKPVIAPAKGCLSDQHSDKGGILFQHNHDLGPSLNQATSWSKHDLARMGKHNKTLARNNSPEVQAQATAQIYKNLVSQ